MRNDVIFREEALKVVSINIRFETTHCNTSRKAGLFIAAIIQMRLPLRTGEEGRLLS
jgi:hypothetical protein